MPRWGIERVSKRPGHQPADGCGCSSGVEHNLAKVGVEGSNPFARSKLYRKNQYLREGRGTVALRRFRHGVHMMSPPADVDTSPSPCLARLALRDRLAVSRGDSRWSPSGQA